MSVSIRVNGIFNPGAKGVHGQTNMEKHEKGGQILNLSPFPTMINFNIIIIESAVYIIMSIFIGFLLRHEDLKRIKRLILFFYLVIVISVYSVLYFTILSAVILSVALFILKFYEY